VKPTWSESANAVARMAKNRRLIEGYPVREVRCPALRGRKSPPFRARFEACSKHF
jgi:hypothetical protein